MKTTHREYKKQACVILSEVKTYDSAMDLLKKILVTRPSAICHAESTEKSCKNLDIFQYHKAKVAENVKNATAFERILLDFAKTHNRIACINLIRWNLSCNFKRASQRLQRFIEDFDVKFGESDWKSLKIRFSNDLTVEYHSLEAASEDLQCESTLAAVTQLLEVRYNTTALRN